MPPQSKQKFLSAASSDGFGFCSVILCVVFCSVHRISCFAFNHEFRLSSGWDMHDTMYSRELLISNRANGYRDVLASIDLSTFRRIPWEGNVPFFLVSFFDPETKEPICVDPRGVLKRATEIAAARGLECFAGCEYEVSTFSIRSECRADLTGSTSILKVLPPVVSIIRNSLYPLQKHQILPQKRNFRI
jgi:glutamine synthetase